MRMPRPCPVSIQPSEGARHPHIHLPRPRQRQGNDSKKQPGAVAASLGDLIQKAFLELSLLHTLPIPVHYFNSGSMGLTQTCSFVLQMLWAAAHKSLLREVLESRGTGNTIFFPPHFWALEWRVLDFNFNLPSSFSLLPHSLLFSPLPSITGAHIWDVPFPPAAHLNTSVWSDPKCNGREKGATSTGWSH